MNAVGFRIAVIWQGRNISPAGSKPVIVYDQEYYKSYYGNKTVGISRYWTAKAQDDRADLLIEIQRNSEFPPDRCQLYPSLDAADAGYYKILQVQQITDEDGQPVTDLTLERLDAVDEP